MVCTYSTHSPLPVVDNSFESSCQYTALPRVWLARRRSGGIIPIFTGPELSSVERFCSENLKLTAL